jgi:penicillin-binding protein 1A
VSALSPTGRSQALAERLVLIALVIGATGILFGVLLVPTAVVASDTLDFVAGDLLDVGPLPEAEAPPENSFIYAADGSLLAEINFNENREPASLEQIPDVIEQAVIATEDAEFYDHHGINVQAIMRAGLSNLEAGSIQGGGSTITQQYVKNAFLADRATEQSLDRKIVEAVWAVELEKRLDKDEILERYLNRIYFGSGAYGVAAAADRYFSVPLKDLTLPQAATLAGTIRNPNQNNPLDNPQAAKARRDIVLRQMAAEGFITEQQKNVAQATPLETKPAEIPPPNEPFWVEWITRQLTNENVAEAIGPGATEPLELMGEDAESRIATVFQGGLRIHTTLDPEFQQLAEQAIMSRLTYEDEPPAEVAQEPMGGIVSIEPGSGAVRTMALGPDTFGSCAEEQQWAGVAEDGQLLCTKTKVNPLVPGGGGSGRQPGSSFKPYVAAAALESGIPPGWTVDATEGQEIEGCVRENGEPWEPGNTGGSGPTDMYAGVKGSVNVFFAKLIAEIGPTTAADMATRLGLREWGEYHANTDPPYKFIGCSLGLGATDVTPFEMANAYATIANRGEYCAPFAIQRIETADGRVLYEHTNDCERVVGEDVMDRLIDIMQGPVTPGGTASDLQARMGAYPVRGKTGTTNDSRDAWFMGYIKQLATAAWIGYPNGERFYETREQAAAVCPEFYDGVEDEATGNPADYGPDATPKCPPTVKLMQNVVIGGNGYQNVYGGTIPAPMWGDYMTQAAQRFEPEGFPAPGPQASVSVPNLAAAGTVAEAREIAEGAGLNLIVRTVTSYEPAGTIIGQDPAAGTAVRAGNAVYLLISDGEGQFPTVPDVTGLEQAEAEQVLREAGYEPLVFNKPTNKQREVGIVLSQSPSPGEPVEPGAGVQVVIQVGTPRSGGDDDPPDEPTESPPPDDGGGGGGGDDDGPGNGRGNGGGGNG